MTFFWANSNQIENTNRFLSSLLAVTSRFLIVLIFVGASAASALPCYDFFNGSRLAYKGHLELLSKTEYSKLWQEVVVRFPKLDARIEEIGASIKDLVLDENPSGELEFTTTLLDIPDFHPRDKERFTEAIKEIKEELGDSSAWSYYVTNLMRDAAVEVVRSNNTARIENLSKGILPRNVVLLVLYKRSLMRGEPDLQTIPHKKSDFNPSGLLNSADFHKYVVAGPFIDAAVAKSMHGALPHLIQRDFVARVVLSIFANEGPNYFYSKLAVDEWAALFDSQVSSSGSRPENVENKILKDVPH